MTDPASTRPTEADPLETCRRWLGRSETRRATLLPWPVAALAASLDHDDPWPDTGAALPPAGHWLYFHDATPLSRLGPDGHARLGSFLPPIPLPRRMWAGGSLRFHRPLPIGAEAERVSTVADLQVKSGRTGPLWFLTLRHEVFSQGERCVEEDQTLVYRGEAAGAAPAAAGQPVPDPPVWSRRITPGPVLLFRYSALTFNGHRIHYDRSYCAEVEGYPGLLVHAPLMATLMLDLVRRHAPDRSIAEFRYRALAPVFDTAPFTVNGRPDADGTAALWISRADGTLAMRGEVR